MANRGFFPQDGGFLEARKNEVLLQKMLVLATKVMHQVGGMLHYAVASLRATVITSRGTDLRTDLDRA